MAVTRDPYDERPYTEHAYAETHPSRVAAVARLSGWEPPPVESAAIVELGCGRGGNLLPIAAGLPGAKLVGVDRSHRQIADARRVATGAALDNVVFVCAGFEEVGAAGGSFDYVICHGVLSWVPASVRALLLGRIARSLVAGGVAHVSFNVLPGWYERLAVRDWLRFAASSMGLSAEGAVASLTWLRDQVSPEQVDYRRRIEAVTRRLGETDPAYAQHEYLADEHHPLSIATFLAEASEAGLEYLGDAVPATTAVELLPDATRLRARTLDTAGAQQLVDFVRCTTFRRTLLVRADEARSRSWRTPPELDRSAIRSLHVASRLRPQGPPTAARSLETFEEGGQGVQVTDATLRRALHDLAGEAPGAIRFEDLARAGDVVAPAEDACREFVSELFDLWLATGAIDLLAAPPALSRVAGDRPTACPVARWNAIHGGTVTNRLHQEVQIPDAVVRWVLARLDGTRSRFDLARDMRSLADVATASDAEIDALVAASIDCLVACALIARA